LAAQAAHTLALLQEAQLTMLQRTQVLLKSWKLVAQVTQTLVALQRVQLLIAQVTQLPLKTVKPGLHWMQTAALGQDEHPGSVQGWTH
jgi:hypothetical protein